MVKDMVHLARSSSIQIRISPRYLGHNPRWAGTGHPRDVPPWVSVRWSPSEHRLAPLDKALVDSIRTNIPSITRTPAGTETLTVNNIIITIPTLSTTMAVHRTPMVCCQGRNDTQQNFDIKAIIGQCYNLKISISAIIDSGCLATNIIKSGSATAA